VGVGKSAWEQITKPRAQTSGVKPLIVTKLAVIQRFVPGYTMNLHVAGRRYRGRSIIDDSEDGLFT